DDAVRNFERALRMAEKTRPGSQDVRDLHLELGQAYEGKGDLERAEALMRKALSEEEQRLRGIEGSLVKRMFRFREQRERDNESLRVVVDNLAGVLDKRGQYAEAEQFYLRDLTIMQDGIKQHHLYKVWIAYPLA